MTHQEKLDAVISYWLEKAQESLAAAQDEMTACRLSFAVNRIYYACFYAASAVLLQQGLQFKKHSGVKASLHKHLVKGGLISHRRVRGSHLQLSIIMQEKRPARVLKLTAGRFCF
jgi:uncharacterized protein (UPF0332 family)